MATETLNSAINGEVVDDDLLCSDATTTSSIIEQEGGRHPVGLNCANGYLKGEARIERAWAHWKKLGEPKLIVAPMVDNSELPFRLLCRKHGAQAAYTPMLHSRIFSENEKYRSLEFTTCKVSNSHCCVEIRICKLLCHWKFSNPVNLVEILYFVIECVQVNSKELESQTH